MGRDQPGHIPPCQSRRLHKTDEMAGQVAIRRHKLTAVKFNSQLGYMGRSSSNSGNTALVSMTESREEQ